ncbi:MAG: NAD(P)/FAD-dependent oxidoreductase [Pleurocapsa sp.]
MLSRKPRIIIVGGGFAGLRLIRKLAQANAEIILIDRHNYHTFVPLLYQVATGFVTPETIAYPFRKYLRSIKNTRFIQAEVQKVNFDAKVVNTKAMDLSYDYLVLATGSSTRFLGVDGAADYALPMRTLEDAIAIKDRLIGNFERASLCQDIERRRQLLTIAIVGGGATGVELAGSIIELVRDTLAQDYPNISTREVRVILIHSGTRLLADYPQDLSDYTSKQLRRKGVKTHFQSRVRKVMPGEIILDDGTVLEAAAIIWTAGVEADYPQPKNQIPTAKKDKICVTANLQLPGYPEVYAIGDVALVKQNGEPLLGIAPEALQQGTAVAHNLRRQLREMPPQPFKYFNKGKAAIIARNNGVAYLFGKIPLKGFAAWLMWFVIHLYYLPGIANRFVALGRRLRDYLTKERDLRQLFDYQNIKQSKLISMSKNNSVMASKK